MDKHAPCRSCGYDVFGLPAGGNCPECGAPVALSIHGDRLSDADPKWLKRLHRGTTLTAAIMTFGTGWPFLGFAIALLGSEFALHLWMLVVLAAAALWLIGVFVTTVKEPAENHLTREQVWLRVLTVASLVVLMIVAPRMVYNRLGPVELFSLWTLLLATYFLHSRHTGKLATRAQQMHLAASIRDNGIWMLLGHLLVVAAFAAEVGLFILLWIIFTWVVIGMAAYQQHEIARELRIAALVSRDQRDYLNAKMRSPAP